MDHTDKTVTWVDNGLFVDFAIACSFGFKKTNYFTPWVSSFPTSNSLLPGDGFKSIERQKWFWDLVDETDLFVFPDVYFGDVQEHLDKLGKRVWGGRRGELLELYRISAKKIFAEHGLPVNHFEVVTGVNALREYLKQHPNVFVKISLTRGDMETFHSETYKLIEPFIDTLEQRLGAKKDYMVFIVEDAICGDGVIETGYDGYCIDGQFPNKGFFGFEIKDAGYAIRSCDYNELPDGVRRVNDALSPWFKEKKYRGFFSSEIRITEDSTPYFIDSCNRCGSPPNEIYQEMVTNWPEILWAGANGEVVEPEFKHKYGFEVLIHCPFATKNWLPLTIPDSIKPFVKIRNHCKIAGVDYFVPQVGSELPEVGAVLGFGDTLDEAIEHVKENADQIKGFDLEIKIGCIDKALEEIEKAKKFGIEM